MSDSTGLPPASVYGAKVDLDAREAYLDAKAREFAAAEKRNLRLMTPESMRRSRAAADAYSQAIRARDESQARYVAALVAHQADPAP